MNDSVNSNSKPHLPIAMTKFKYESFNKNRLHKSITKARQKIENQTDNQSISTVKVSKLSI